MRQISNVILTRGTAVLLGWRGSDRRSYPSCWAVPGGHLEHGETAEAAAIREMREELGIEVRALRHLNVIEVTDSLGPVVFHMFASSVWDGEPRVMDEEHSRLRWFDVQEACLLQPLALDGYRTSFRLAVAAP